MDLAAPFERAGDHIAVDLIGGRALFTTRLGGVSDAPYDSLNLGPWTDDDAAAVGENWERAAEHAGGHPVHARQIHGAQALVLDTPLERGAEPEADAVATSTPGLAPAVLVADCLPIAIAGEGAVAMVHAGWRGLAGGVIEAGVRAVRELGASGALSAAIGPGAGGCCYEVGTEVLDAFAAEPPATRNGRLLDLKAIARRRLHLAGVSVVHDVQLCTLHDDPGLFFSHRRDGGVTGRQAGVVWRA